MLSFVARKKEGVVSYNVLYAGPKTCFLLMQCRQYHPAPPQNLFFTFLLSLYLLSIGQLLASYGATNTPDE